MNYEELLEKARETYESEDTPHIVKAWLLANIIGPADESEDEKIRKELIRIYSVGAKVNAKTGDILDKDIVAWLEKQSKDKSDFSDLRIWKYIVTMVLTEENGIGQYLDNPDTERIAKKLQEIYGNIEKQGEKKQEPVQKPFDYENATIHQKDFAPKDEPKFKVGVWFVNNNRKDTFLIKSINSKGYCTLEDIKGNIISPCLPPCESDSHVWTIADAKDGDVLAINWHEDDDSLEKIIIFKKYHNKGVKGLYSMPCVEGYGNTFKNGKLAFQEEIPYYSKTWTANLQPATKEQRELLFQKMKEAGYEWNNSKLITIRKRLNYET